MKVKTYHIVEYYSDGRKYFGAYEWNWETKLIGYNFSTRIDGTVALDADDCEHNLRRVLETKGIKPKVIRVIKV